VPDDLRVNGWLLIPGSELHERFSRSSGPGGQSVNTADSRVELSFDVERSPALPDWARARALERLAGRLAGGMLTVAASEQRSQLANRQAARARLAALVRAAVAPPQRARVPTKPGRGANERRLEAKRNRSAIKRARRYDRRDPDSRPRPPAPRRVGRDDLFVSMVLTRTGWRRLALETSRWTSSKTRSGKTTHWEFT
jgi:ribosome-associated protein